MKAKTKTPEATVEREALAIEWWPADRPKPYPKNARKLSDRAVDLLAQSIRDFGFRQPIVTDDQDVIIAGHTRLLAAQKLGLATVPVHVAHGLTPAQVKAYRLMDNRTADETSWDLDLLEAEMLEMQAQGIDLAATGFEETEVEELLRPPPATEDDDAPEPPAVPVSRVGDVWLLGKHRVMCGDSTDAAAVNSLMDGVKADMVFTDPPYGVEYRDLGLGSTSGKKLSEIKPRFEGVKNDELTGTELQSFMLAVLSNIASTTGPRAALYIWHASRYQREVENALNDAGFEVRTQLIWRKTRPAFSMGHYKWRHEPCFYGGRSGKPISWYGEHADNATVWEIGNDNASDYVHPTQKPVALAEKAIENSSKQGDMLLDLFGGSGSTLIACEKTGRCARLMELDPRYVDVIVDRWQQYTGNEATLEGTGATFAGEKAARGPKT